MLGLFVEKKGPLQDFLFENMTAYHKNRARLLWEIIVSFLVKTKHLINKQTAMFNSSF